MTRVTVDRFYPEMEEATIGAWLVREGERIEAGQPLAEVVTDKVTFDLESPASGVLRRVTVAERSVVPTGFTIALIGDPDEALPDVDTDNRLLLEARTAFLSGASDVLTSAAPPALPSTRAPVIRATPAARRLARERGVNLETVNGTGPDGVVTAEDVTAASDEKSP
jgi:pyruvate dehydrogenase E2 component (dihydrolipoamide acetyltransferase)